MTALLDRWTIRSTDASVAFRGRAHRFAPTVQARFAAVTGTVGEQDVEVEVDVRSLTTGNPLYDELLTAADPFDAARHPVARYCADRIRWRGDEAAVEGTLTVRGRSTPVPLTARRRDLVDGVALLSATGRVDRRDLDLRLDVPGAGALLPAHLTLDIAVTALRAG